jgi:hypothetical protein
VDPKVNDEFHVWCENIYGSNKVGHVKVVRGKKHNYLAMILDFSTPGAMKLDMRYYITSMIGEFPYNIKAIMTTPWTEKLFKVNDESKKLEEERRAIFHNFIMKAMFLCKRARPGVNPAIGFLSSRVREPSEGDWNKLLKVLGFLNGTIDDVLTLEADNTQTMSWYIDAAFAVHTNMKSHTGAILTMGKGAIISDSLKQKVNVRSSTESEIVGVDDEISKVIWAKMICRISRFQSESEYRISRQYEFHEVGTKWKGKFRLAHSTL